MVTTSMANRTLFYPIEQYKNRSGSGSLWGRGVSSERDVEYRAASKVINYYVLPVISLLGGDWKCTERDCSCGTRLECYGKRKGYITNYCGISNSKEKK